MNVHITSFLIEVHAKEQHKLQCEANTHRNVNIATSKTIRVREHTLKMKLRNNQTTTGREHTSTKRKHRNIILGEGYTHTNKTTRERKHMKIKKIGTSLTKRVREHSSYKQNMNTS